MRLLTKPQHTVWIFFRNSSLCGHCPFALSTATTTSFAAAACRECLLTRAERFATEKIKNAIVRPTRSRTVGRRLAATVYPIIAAATVRYAPQYVDVR